MNYTFIRLECKSKKQLQRTCAELAALGIDTYLLSDIDKAVGEGRGVSFCVTYNTYTIGAQATCVNGAEKYYKRKEFIAAVKRVLGESKWN